MQIQAAQSEQRKVKKKLIDALNRMEEKKKVAQPNSATSRSAYRINLDQSSHILKNDSTHSPRSFKEILFPFSRSHSQPKIVDISTSRRYYHPPSKIMLKSPKDGMKDFLGLEGFLLSGKPAERRDEQPEFFKLGIHSPSSFRNSLDFKRYYAGGPLDEDERIFQVNYYIFEERNNLYRVDIFLVMLRSIK